METTTIKLDSGLVNQALIVSRAQGVDLSNVIENYLISYISSPKKEIIEEEYPDIVLSLLGQGEQIADNDKRGTEAFFEHIIKKNSWKQYFGY